MLIKPKTIAIGVILSISMSLAAFSSATFESASSSPMPNQGSSRTVDYRWYSFFDVPQDPWVWGQRYLFGYGDQLVHATYPVVYRWEPEPNWIYFYSSARLNTKGRSIPEIYIDHPVMLPYNLMGTLPAGIQGGVSNITNWHLNYTNQARSTALGINQDGYVNELTGDISMDKNATMKILGITEADFNTFASWWSANQATVKKKWRTWLDSEGGYKNTKGRVDVRPFTNFYLSLDFYFVINLKSSDSAKVVLTIDWCSWGMEALLAKWFHETFMTGYEWWWDDFHFNATIRPTETDVDLDTGVTWALYQWSYNDTAYQEPVWVWEGQGSGDVPSQAANNWPGVGDFPNSPAYPYYLKTYYVVTPGNDWYDAYGTYDYCPGAWDLKEGETLTFDWSDTYKKGKVWCYKQLPWTPPQKPINTLLNVTGYIRFDNASEPFPTWGQFPQVNYNPMAKTIRFTGPINMTDLSWNGIRSEWTRLADASHPNGLLPWGCPFLEFRIATHGDVDYNGNVNAADLSLLNQAFGSDPSKPNWIASCDMNWNSRVDVVDLAELGKNYGITP